MKYKSTSYVCGLWVLAKRRGGCFQNNPVGCRSVYHINAQPIHYKDVILGLRLINKL